MSDGNARRNGATLRSGRRGPCSISGFSTAEATIAQAARELEALAGCQHVIRTDDCASGQALVTADLGTDAADAALTRVRGLGVPAEGRPAAAAGVDRAARRA